MKSIDTLFNESELKYIFEAPNDNPEAVAAAEEEDPTDVPATPEGAPGEVPPEEEDPTTDTTTPPEPSAPTDPFGGGGDEASAETPVQSDQPATAEKGEPTDSDLMTLDNKRETIVKAMTDQWNLSVKMEGTPSYLRVDGVLNDTQRAVIQAMAEEMGVSVKYENASLGNSKITKIFFTPVIIDPKKAARNFIKMYSKGGVGPGMAPQPPEAAPVG